MDFPTDKQYIAVIDFEATCSNTGLIPRDEMEIIEFAGVIIDKEINEIERFSRFIRPVRYPILTDFCKRLTTITQKDVDSASTFPEVIQEFKSLIEKYDPLFASWGKYDKNQLQQDCKYHNIEYPFGNSHLDIKRWVPQFYEFDRPKGIGGMLKYLGLEFKGTPHRGIDDVQNIIQILLNIQDHSDKE